MDDPFLSQAMRLLILGGAMEASILARRIGGREDLHPVLSFAGRTQKIPPQPIPHRVGGFGGAEGLKTYLAENEVQAVIDATHPFAARISENAEIACQALGIPLAIFTRPAWAKHEGDRWTGVADMEEAVRTLGNQSRRVFLTVGGLQLAAFAAAPWHHYVVRTIEPPDAIAALPSSRLILARGPFGVEDEIAVMRDERIDILVTKNSGGAATEAKIAAARALGIIMIVVERPPLPAAPIFHSVDEILAWIERHRPAP
jgi:precorrin-6A/cobalt-precorrin-6A reductase